MHIGLEYTVLARHREMVERVELESARRIAVDESRFLPPRHRVRSALRALRRTLVHRQARGAAARSIGLSAPMGR